jgi:NAD(P)-dependent dehydrogenase (short-subunit alcohol dehydrogenase family)
MFKKHPSASPTDAKQIVFVGSMASYQGMTGVPSYGGAKFGVRGIFKAMREIAPDVLGEGRESVKINMIAPSWIRSGMTDRIVPYLEKNHVTVGTPEDCAKIVLRMCADEGVKGMSKLIERLRRTFANMKQGELRLFLVVVEVLIFVMILMALRGLGRF